MERVSSIPEPQVTRKQDPWFAELFASAVAAARSGEKIRLKEPEWKVRYRTPRSAASAIGQAAAKREADMTIAIRGREIYVQANNVKAPRTRKAPVKKAPEAPTRKAPAKRAAKAAG